MELKLDRDKFDYPRKSIHRPIMPKMKIGDIFIYLGPLQNRSEFLVLTDILDEGFSFTYISDNDYNNTRNTSIFFTKKNILEAFDENEISKITSLEMIPLTYEKIEYEEDYL